LALFGLAALKSGAAAGVVGVTQALNDALAARSESIFP
jgi:hypothetical protein